MTITVVTVMFGMRRLNSNEALKPKELSHGEFQPRNFNFRKVAQDLLAGYSVLQLGIGNATDIHVNQTKPVLKNSKFIDTGTLEGSTEAKPVDISKLKPLDNYYTYPCLSSLPIFPESKWASDGKCVRTVKFEDLGENTTSNYCKSVRTPRGTTPICIYPAKTDIWVSGSISKGGLWEADLIAKLAGLLRSKPDAELLDLGCNIGVYTVSIAHQGTRVTAIDPMVQNLKLMSKSLSLGKLHENVTIIWNAVGNTHNIVKFKPDLNNVGGTRVEDFISSASENTNIDLARTITLDDLVPLFRGKKLVVKIDIEETEYNALLGAQNFFKEVDVLVIQMEFQWHKKGPDGPKIIQYLASKGFRPYRDLNKQSSLNPSLMAAWPGDIYFLKP